MGESLADWLSLREAADASARSVALVTALVDVLPTGRPVRVVDLGTGTGSNVRYLAPRLPSPQEWLVVDRDPDLLSRIELPPVINMHVETRAADLGYLMSDLFVGRDLVTASALLDLVSARWITDLAQHCRAYGARALFALNYNGESTCSPSDADDALVLELFNDHQRHNDKGFGRAAGPDATDAAAVAFSAVGYRVMRSQTDWDLPPSTAAMQRYLIAGWAEAAIEMAPGQTARIQAWHGRRLTYVNEGRSHLTVGHYDLLAIP